jgi:transposase-like protein
VATDKAPTYPRVLDELVPADWHNVEQYENNRIEADHGRLKHLVRPMRGLSTDRGDQVIIAALAKGHSVRRPDNATASVRTHPADSIISIGSG